MIVLGSSTASCTTVTISTAVKEKSKEIRLGEVNEIRSIETLTFGKQSQSREPLDACGIGRQLLG